MEDYRKYTSFLGFSVKSIRMQRMRSLFPVAELRFRSGDPGR